MALDDSAGLVLFDFDDDGHDDHGAKDGHAAITTEPDVMPTAAQIKKLRRDLEPHPIDCIFGEPFLGQKAVRLIDEGSDIRIGQLDPLGSQLPAGASLYADLLKSYAAAFKGCLAP